MPPKEGKGGKSKQIQAAKSAAKSGGKAKKKKWSKAKTKEKLANLVVFDKATYDKMLKDIPTAKLITPSVVSDRLKVNGSLARKAIRELVTKGLIKPVIHHRRQTIATRIGKGVEEEAPTKAATKGAKAPSKKAAPAKKAEEAPAEEKK